MGKIPITHSGIAAMPHDARKAIINTITADLPNRAFLRYLTLFKRLPARDAWIERLGELDSPVNWAPLMTSVGRTLGNQSQEATDCQWVSLLFRITSGQLQLPTDELNRQIAEYPYFGDQRGVRPSIRAGEVTFADKNVEGGWSESFWEECLDETACQLPNVVFETSQTQAKPVVENETVDRMAEYLVQHSRLCLHTSKVDAKLDTVFGVALYCLNILREIIGHHANSAVLARIGLRSVLEGYVTLAYLVKRNDPALWKSYRVYGAGQGKLAFLKIDESSERPAHVSIETLRAIANEDQWEEFLSIDIGHWGKSNLRSMSEIAGVKADYDQYYIWPSAFAHSQWGAVRTTVFATCLNPLHRLHRIPLMHARKLDDVIPDVTRILDKILGLVGDCYPSFEKRLIAAIDAESN